MADFLSRVGRFFSQTPVQRSKAPENKQPIEKRADGKRSHLMASHSSVKSLKSRVISIGSPKKAKLTPASKSASDTSPDLQLTPASKPASDSSSDLQLTPASKPASDSSSDLQLTPA